MIYSNLIRNNFKFDSRPCKIGERLIVSDEIEFIFHISLTVFSNACWNDIFCVLSAAIRSSSFY